jgi:hypothetical protein
LASALLSVERWMPSIASISGMPARTMLAI